MNKKNILLKAYYGIIFMSIFPLLSNSFTTSILQNCWGHYERYNGNKPAAQQLFNAVKQHKPEYDKFTLAGRVELLFDNKEYKEIVSLYNTNPTLFAQQESLKIYALSLAKLGKTKESDAIFIKLNQENPSDSEIAFYAIYGYINNKDLHNALHIIDQLLSLNSSRGSFIFYFLQAQIFLEMNDVTQSKTAVKKALALNPDFDKAWLLFSILSEQEQLWQDAIKGYTTFLSLQQKTPSSEPIKKRIFELALLQEKATKKHKAPNHLLDRFDEALIHVEHKHYKQALVCIEHCITHDPENKNFALLKIEILLHLKEYNTLADFCILLIKQNEPENNDWYKMVYYLTRKEKQFTPYAITLLKNNTIQNGPTPLLYLADMYIQEKQWPDAEKILTDLLISVKDKDLRGVIQHQLGMIYFIQKHYENAITILNEHLADFPNHVPSLNLLANAYITTKNIKKAAKIVARGRVADPKNPHLMDTHALILFHQKNYAQAQKLLTHALMLAPTDATIILHLAEIAYIEGDITKTKELISKAKEHAFYDHEHQAVKELDNKLFPRQ